MQSVDASLPASVPWPSTALLLCDVQNFVTDQLSALNATDTSALLSRLSSLLSACRQRSVLVVYVRSAFRPSFPESCPSNKTFARFQGANPVPEGSPAVEIHPALQPLPTDVLVTKRRVSAFYGTDLELVLRARGVRHLVVAGVLTSRVVLSTVTAAADLDLVVTVVRDGCWDRDEEVHRVLMDKVFPHQATVQSVAEVLKRLEAS